MTVAMERSGVMFPKGAHQMIAYCYAMEGVPAYDANVHACMMMMVEDGDIEAFDVRSVNMQGSKALERRGECAIKRRQIEQLLTWEEVAVIRAKYGDHNIKANQEAIVDLADMIHAYLTGGRYRADRGKGYILEMIIHVSTVHRGKGGRSVFDISQSHFIRERYAFRDAGSIQKWMGERLRSAISKIEQRYSDGSVLPLPSKVMP